MLIKFTLIFPPQNYALISNWRLYFRERKQETFVETGGVVHVMRIAVCIVEVQMQEIQIDGLKSQLNDKQINKTGKKFLMTMCR